MEYQGDIVSSLKLFKKTNIYPVALPRALGSLVQVHALTVLGVPVPTQTQEVSRVLQVHLQPSEVPVHHITAMEGPALLNRVHRQAMEVPVHHTIAMGDQVQPTRALGVNEAHQDMGVLGDPHQLTCLLRHHLPIQVLTSFTLQT